MQLREEGDKEAGDRLLFREISPRWGALAGLLEQWWGS